MSSLVADYESDSSSDVDDESSSKKSNQASSAITEAGSLTSADLLLDRPIHGKALSIFANPYLEKESISRDCLEKHVKLTATKESPMEKKKTCWKFLKGRCPHGSNCQYSHTTETFAHPLVKATTEADHEEKDEIELKKRKKPGLAKGLVPPKKFMKVYNKSKATN